MDDAQLRKELDNLKTPDKKEVRVSLERIINQVEVTKKNMSLLKEALDIMNQKSPQEIRSVYQKLIDKCPHDLLAQFYEIFNEYSQQRPASAETPSEDSGCDWIAWYH